MDITVTVHPNSRKPRIEKDLFNQLHVYVDQPPLEGRANVAVAKALADYFSIAKSQVQLIKGVKGKLKTFRIS
jgi:uncharacterized protein YggU (UPF0235/DUF167 family)